MVPLCRRIQGDAPIGCTSAACCTDTFSDADNLRYVVGLTALLARPNCSRWRHQRISSAILRSGVHLNPPSSAVVSARFGGGLVLC